MKFFRLILALGILTSSGLAQDAAEPPAPQAQPAWQQALESAKKDLAKSLEKLTAIRTRIAKEKPALATAFEAARSELITKRRQAELARMSREDRNAALADDRRQLASLKQDLNYTSGLIGDLPEQIKTRANPVETKLLEEQFANQPNPSKPVEERLAAQGKVIDSALDRIESLLGGRIIEASAVTEDGSELQGKAALIGPLTIFSNSQAGGQVHEGSDSIPKISSNAAPSAAAALVSGQEASLKLDLTGGAAKALDDLDSGPLDLIKQGGAWVYPILLIALISAICGLIKFAQLAKIRNPKEGWIASILSALRSGKQEEAIELAKNANHPASQVLSQALEASDAGADVVEEVIYESMIGVNGRLQKWLPFIAITAATAPLLGLLGTVSGMIRTFNVIQIYGSGDPKPLAGGISEALITTLFGLVVAIPALILHAMLSRRCQGILQSTEQLGLTLVNGLRRDELKRK